MEIINIPFEQLKISKMNMRHSEPPPDTSHIRPSIRTKGILQPLLVREEGKGFGVVFGRSRYHSAKEERAEGNTNFDALPCIIMQDSDDADALEASIIENYARRDPHPMSLYEKFVHLLKMKRTEEGIALTFGKTTAQVNRCLALGKLVPGVRSLFRADEIDADTAAALTMASGTQQREWLALHEKHRAPTGKAVKNWLLGGQQIATTAALFPLENYKGQTVGDLFAELGKDGQAVSYFRDLDLFWELQNAAIADKAESLKAEGWEHVHVLEVGDAFHPYGYVKTGKDKGGHVYISVAYNGVVEIHKGYLTRKEVEASEKAAERAAKKVANDGKVDNGPPQPAMTQTLENYLHLHRHAVVCADLLKHRKTAFRLLVAHAFASSGNWKLRSEPQTARSDTVAASIEKSSAQAALAAQKEAVEALMGLGQHPTTGKAFARLLELTDAEVMRVAVVVMADTLAVGDAIVDAVGAYLGTDARRFWQPDDTFFELVRDRGTVNALLAEVGGKPIAKANIAEKAKTQKAIIRDYLAGTNGRAKVEGWLPGWMEYPYRALGAKPKKAKAEACPIAIAAE
jgi:ParB family chromosome partitioning protein